MSLAENKAVVRRIVDAVWNGANLAAIEELFDPTFSVHGQVLGPDGVRRLIQRLRQSFPDGAYTIEDLVAEGDRVVLRWTHTGTQQGALTSPLFGVIAPTGKRSTMAGINIFRLAGGKAVEVWQVGDLTERYRQLGLGSAVPPTEANKAVVRRLVEEVWNGANPAAAEELLAPDYGHQGTVLGPDGLRKNLTGLRTTLPDLHYTVDDLVAEGDRVVLRWQFTGTHAGPAQLPLVPTPVPPTGQSITVRGMTMFRVVDGKLVEYWALPDRLAWFEQLELTPGR